MNKISILQIGVVGAMIFSGFGMSPTPAQANQLTTKAAFDPIGAIYRTAMKFLSHTDAQSLTNYESDLAQVAKIGGTEFYFKVAEVLAEPETVEILALEPKRASRKDPNQFRGWAVSQRFSVTNPGDRDKLLAGLRDGVANAFPPDEKCFVARHGLRVMSKGKQVEMVFSFQCSRVSTYLGPAFISEVQINPRQELGFNNMLTQLGAGDR